MAGNRKYAGLPDLDLAPDVYQTPELTDDASTRPTSTALRSESRASIDGEDEDEDTGVNRRGLDTDEARTTFMSARVDAREADFSDRIDSRRKSYQVSSRRRRKGGVTGNDLQYSSDEDESPSESLRRRIARLNREAEELKAEVQRQHASGEEQKDIRHDSLETLGQTLKALNTSYSPGSGSAGEKLAHRLNGTAGLAPVAANGGTKIQSQSYQSTAAAKQSSHQQIDSLASIADFDARITLLEAALGLDSMPLATQPGSTTKAVIPTLDVLDRQISVLTSLTPSFLESVGKRVLQLTLEVEKLDESRRSARAALEAFSSNSNPAESKAVQEGSELEQTSKINALYGTLPTIESLAPLLPSVLDRLRSLRLIHAEAANANQSLLNAERRQAEMGEEIKRWREGLEQVEKIIRDNEVKMGQNVKAAEGWVKELEGRTKKLQI